MVQGRSRARLALESFQGLRIPRCVLGKKFQRDAAVETGVLRAVNDAHSTAAQLFLNTIVGNCLSRERPRFRHGPVILGARPDPSQCIRPGCRCKVRMSGLCKVEMSVSIGGRGAYG